jgi:peptidoglycan/LPS O-acetylase OafA/YrhL
VRPVRILKTKVIKDLRIPPFTSVRFLLVLVLFFHHLPEPYRFDNGYMVVSSFFMFSGFGLFVKYNRKRMALKEFFLGRLSRVYPVHLLTLAIAAILAVTILSGDAYYHGRSLALDFVAQLFLVQSFTTGYYSFNPVAWFLSSLVFLYILFPFLLWTIRRSSGIFVLASLVFYGAYAALVLRMGWDIYYAFYICPVARLLDFSVGMALGRLYLSKGIFSRIFISSIGRRWAVFLLELGALFVLLYSLFILMPSPSFFGTGDPFRDTFGSDIGSVILDDVYYLFFSVVFVLVFLIARKSGGSVIYKALSRPGLVRLGEISFSFFMLQYLVILILTRTLSDAGLVGLGPVIVLALAVSLIISYLVWRFYEVPTRDGIRRLFSVGH